MQEAFLAESAEEQTRLRRDRDSISAISESLSALQTDLLSKGDASDYGVYTESPVKAPPPPLTPPVYTESPVKAPSPPLTPPPLTPPPTPSPTPQAMEHAAALAKVDAAAEAVHNYAVGSPHFSPHLSMRASPDPAIRQSLVTHDPAFRHSLVTHDPGFRYSLVTHDPGFRYSLGELPSSLGELPRVDSAAEAIHSNLSSPVRQRQPAFELEPPPSLASHADVLVQIDAAADAVKRCEESPRLTKVEERSSAISERVSQFEALGRSALEPLTPAGNPWQAQEEETTVGGGSMVEAEMPRVSTPAVQSVNMPAASTPEVPTPEVPTVEVPKAEVPKAEVPKAEVPKAEVPEAVLPSAGGRRLLETDEASISEAVVPATGAARLWENSKKQDEAVGFWHWRITDD